jgi:hypothetical protein
LGRANLGLVTLELAVVERQFRVDFLTWGGSDICRGESGFCAIIPFNRFRSPVILIIVDICPFCLLPFAIGLQP